MRSESFSCPQAPDGRPSSGWRGWVEGQEPAQDKERNSTLFSRQGQAWSTEPAKAGLVGPGFWCQELFPPCSPSLAPPQPSSTFQRLFIRYFLSKIWDLRRRLQRLAFSARLLSQGWARHWAALMRALWGGGSVARVCGMLLRRCQPRPRPACTCMHWALTHGLHILQGASPLVLDNEVGDKVFGLI